MLLDGFEPMVPAAAPADAKPFGKWSVIARADGSKQWAMKGKPLYTFVKDDGPGSVGGYGARAAEQTPPTTPPSKGPILIVDDNPTNLKLVTFLVKAHGYDVDTAVDADAALAAIRDNRPTVILMDLQLPGIDGLELTRRLKSDPATRAIPVIAVTGTNGKTTTSRLIAHIFRHTGKCVGLTTTDGILRSEVFPGLWLDPSALLNGDTQQLRAVVELGCATSEHGDFLLRLADHRSPS